MATHQDSDGLQDSAGVETPAPAHQIFKSVTQDRSEDAALAEACRHRAGVIRPMRQRVARRTPEEPSRARAIIVGQIPSRPREPKEDALRRRVLAAVRRYNCLLPYRGPGDLWGGCISWWLLRGHIGGRVSREELRAACDQLIEAGEIVEVWLDPGGARAVPHAFALPEVLLRLRYRIAAARGLPEALGRAGSSRLPP